MEPQPSTKGIYSTVDGRTFQYTVSSENRC